MPADIWEPSDDDTGFVCKACGIWFADHDVKEWDTKWADSSADAEPELLAIIHKCPLCCELRTYVPNECILRGQWFE
jgi:hypothetical protein